MSSTPIANGSTKPFSLEPSPNIFSLENSENSCILLSMRGPRWLFFGALLGCTVMASASFEMVMVLDKGTKSIKRYDPETGAYLGEFAKNRFFNATSMSVDPSRNRVYVGDTDTALGYTVIHAFNYNTGEKVAQYYSAGWYGAYGLIARGDNAYFLDASPTPRLLQFNTTQTNPTSTVTTLLLNNAGATVSNRNQGVAIGNDLYWSSSTELSKFSLSTSSYFPSVVAGAFAGAARAVSGEVLVGFSGGGLINLYTSLGNYAGGSIIPTATSVRAVASGHFEHYALANTPGGFVIARQNSVYPFNHLGTFGLGTMNDPAFMGVVTAPEPSTMVVAGLGIAAMLRRRKSK